MFSSVKSYIKRGVKEYNDGDIFKKMSMIDSLMSIGTKVIIVFALLVYAWWRFGLLFAGETVAVMLTVGVVVQMLRMRREKG